jgi:hypothetical protein
VVTHVWFVISFDEMHFDFKQTLWPKFFVRAHGWTLRDPSWKCRSTTRIRTYWPRVVNDSFLSFQCRFNNHQQTPFLEGLVRHAGTQRFKHDLFCFQDRESQFQSMERKCRIDTLFFKNHDILSELACTYIVLLDSWHPIPKKPISLYKSRYHRYQHITTNYISVLWQVILWPTTAKCTWSCSIHWHLEQVESVVINSSCLTSALRFFLHWSWHPKKVIQ